MGWFELRNRFNQLVPLILLINVVNRTRMFACLFSFHPSTLFGWIWVFEIVKEIFNVSVDLNHAKNFELIWWSLERVDQKWMKRLGTLESTQYLLVDWLRDWFSLTLLWGWCWSSFLFWFFQLLNLVPNPDSNFLFILIIICCFYFIHCPSWSFQRFLKHSCSPSEMDQSGDCIFSDQIESKDPYSVLVSMITLTWMLSSSGLGTTVLSPFNFNSKLFSLLSALLQSNETFS